MQQAKLPVTINPFGILFNPATIASTLDRLRCSTPFSEQDMIIHNGLWISLAHHGRFSSTDRSETLADINQALVQGTQALEQADYLILTLGTAWIYRYKATGEVVANCHKLPASAFERRRLTPDEIVNALEGALRPHLNNKQVFLTVSPVRHAGDGLVENQLSKSSLIVAAGELCERHPESIHYFPAYEIVMDELRDYRFYQADMMHPSEVAIQYIWERFAESALTPACRTLISQIEALQNAMSHCPINPHSGAHRQFRSRMKAEAEHLQHIQPELDFSAEITYFTD